MSSRWWAFSPRRHFRCQWWQCNNPLCKNASSGGEMCSLRREQQPSPGKMCHFEIAPLSSLGFIISSALACTNYCPRDIKGLTLSFLLELRNAFVSGVAISFPSASWAGDFAVTSSQIICLQQSLSLPRADNYLGSFAMLQQAIAPASTCYGFDFRPYVGSGDNCPSKFVTCTVPDQSPIPAQEDRMRNRYKTLFSD